MKILITGSNGLLGQKIVRQLINRNIPFLATSHGENRNPDCPHYTSLDICDENQAEQVISQFNPTHIIHTAAMTNVDACELQPESCRAINTKGTHIVFKNAQRINAHFQLLSTDFVFDGIKGDYAENDPVNPLSVYGKSKVDAENIVLQANYDHVSIVRTIIVYGQANNLSRSNLFLWAKNELSKAKTIAVVDDQLRSPTWADDLAWGCIRICTLKQNGIFHLSGEEKMSIYQLVQTIAKFYGYATHHIIKTSSKQLNQPALRPPNTGFNIEKAKRTLGYSPKTIAETLALLID